jgi:hypothetical protein
VSEFNSQYSELPSSGPFLPKLGSAVISLVEPPADRDREFNRWYEDDHLQMALGTPWLFGGRRWVAPTALQALRLPRSSPLANPLSSGKYLVTYFITEGRYEEWSHWSTSMLRRLDEEKRIFPGVEHIYTGYHDYLGAAYAEGFSPRDIHALQFPFSCLVLEIFDGVDPSRLDDLRTWLTEERIPKGLVASGQSMCLQFAPMPLPPEKQRLMSAPTRDGSRVTCLWFTMCEPGELWACGFADIEENLESTGFGRLRLAAPFWPVRVGTDDYVDQLR